MIDGNNSKIAVNITSCSDRINVCYDVIQGVLSNSVKPYLISLNLPLDQFPNREQSFDDSLQRLVKSNPSVKVNWFSNEKHKTFCFPENFIVIDIDDDVIPNKDLIKNYIQRIFHCHYDVIVSLTSFPVRFRNVSMFLTNLKSLLLQNTTYKYHIVLSLYEKDIELLPSQVIDFCNINDIEILSCKEDLKGNKKFFYVMQKYPTVPIIVVDDDLIFYDNLVESLMNKYMTNDNVIWTGWCQVMNLSKEGHLKYDVVLQYNSTSQVPSFKYKFGSGSGTLIPPFLIDDFDYALSLIHYGDNIYHDELVVKKFSLDKGVKVGLCKNTKYKCDVGGWLTYTQFIENEIQPQVEAFGNLHSINCKKILDDGKLIYRGMRTEMGLLGKYIIKDDEVIKNEIC